MQTHSILVNERWEFVGPEGKLKFSVKDMGLVKGASSENWCKQLYLVEVDIPFEMDGELVRQLISSPRYQGDMLEMVASSECTVGIAQVRPNYGVKADSRVQRKGVVYCAMGSIQAT